MIEFLTNIDKELLLAINGFNGHFLDVIMVFVSSKLGWLPLYLFLLYVIIIDFKWKFWLPLLFVAITITLSDQSSVLLFKNIFLRLRPCHEADLIEKMHMIVGCGGSYGFVSSHAANSLALSAFIISLLKNKHRWIWPVMITYSFLIMYSRVYLGVHYPFDVLAGGMLGILIGLSVHYILVIILKRV